MANTIDFSSTSVGRFGTSCQVDSEEGISASELGMTDSELLQGSHQKRGRDACAKFSLSFWRVVKSWWKTAVIILTPVLFSPLPIVIRDPVCVYLVLLACISWNFVLYVCRLCVCMCVCGGGGVYVCVCIWCVCVCVCVHVCVCMYVCYMPIRMCTCRCALFYILNSPSFLLSPLSLSISSHPPSDPSL